MKFQQFDIYVVHIWRIFWLSVPSNDQEFFTFLADDRNPQPKAGAQNFSKSKGNFGVLAQP